MTETVVATPTLEEYLVALGSDGPCATRDCEREAPPSDMHCCTPCALSIITGQADVHARWCDDKVKAKQKETQE